MSIINCVAFDHSPTNIPSRFTIMKYSVFSYFIDSIVIDVCILAIHLYPITRITNVVTNMMNRTVLNNPISRRYVFQGIYTISSRMFYF